MRLVSVGLLVMVVKPGVPVVVEEVEEAVAYMVVLPPMLAPLLLLVVVVVLVGSLVVVDPRGDCGDRGDEAEGDNVEV